MILVTGGCRSGKSEYGEKLVEAMGTHRLYVATGKVFDDEMAGVWKNIRNAGANCG